MARRPTYAPWLPPKWELADAAAIQALVQGAATADQQQRAVAYIVNALCATYDLSFRPGPDGERDTAFAEGRRFVGLELVKLTKLNLGKMRHDHGRPHD